MLSKSCITTLVYLLNEKCKKFLIYFCIKHLLVSFIKIAYHTVFTMLYSIVHLSTKNIFSRTHGMKKPFIVGYFISFFF